MNADTIHPVVISIIMPAYNAASYIEAALDSIVAQTYERYEVIIIDSLSTDRTSAIVKEKQQNSPRIHFISEKDKGIYDAMNKGTGRARGEWIYFMGSDDRIANKDVFKTISTHLTRDRDLVYGDVVWVPDQLKEEGVCEARHLVDRNINHQRIFYRKSLFDQLGSYDLQYNIAADHELNIRFFCHQQSCKQYVPLTIAYYHAGGFSANRVDKVFWNNWKTIFKQNFSAFLPLREMYIKLGWYCRYCIDHRQYGKAFVLFWDVFFHTFSPGFAWLSFRHFIRSLYKHAV